MSLLKRKKAVTYEIELYYYNGDRVSVYWSGELKLLMKEIDHHQQNKTLWILGYEGKTFIVNWKFVAFASIEEKDKFSREIL